MLSALPFKNKPDVTEMENIKGKPKCLSEPLLACRAAVRLNQEVQLIIHCRESFCSV